MKAVTKDASQKSARKNNPGIPGSKNLKLLSLESGEQAGISIESLLKKALQTTKSNIWLFLPSENKVWLSNDLIDLLSDKPQKSGKPKLSDLIKNNKSNFFDILIKLSDNSKPSEFEFSIPGDKLRTTKVLLCRLSYFKNKNLNYILGVNTDITERKKNENSLLRAKIRAEESDSIKTVFLTNISHEIRTPMNAILGFSELLNIGGQTPEKRDEYLQIIKNKSKQLLSFIDDIAELSMFESGEAAINNSETNLDKLLSELQQQFTKEMQLQKKQNVDLQLKLPNKKKPVIIYSDGGRIAQVLSYLLDNALKFTEKGSVQFGYEIAENKIEFFVKDTGIGIPKSAHKNLFYRFRTREEAYSFRNSGLGLTISRAIVELLGGKIHMESTQGKGSQFYFNIPLVLSNVSLVEEKPDKEDAYNKWRNKVILVAEDDEVNYRFIEAIFADTQVQLIHVLDGLQAVELSKTINKIDLILMDIKMPEKSGYDAIKEIKKFRSDIPIIVQTAYTFKEDKNKCIAAGCDDYISKPIDIELLMSKINHFFSE
jgi:signal transduction histidine kinase/CheY-like chemotaxis protein